MRSRARESDAGIIITVSTCKYVFVVTPEVSHPRRGKRARRPRLRRHGVGCHGGGTLGGGSLLPESRFSALVHRGVLAEEKEGDAKEAREVQPDTHPVCGGRSSSLASKTTLSNTFRSRPRQYETSISQSGREGLTVIIRIVQTSQLDKYRRRNWNVRHWCWRNESLSWSKK